MNKLDGTLPSTFSKNSWLSTLNLNGNQLAGLIPESLSNCTNLELLNLANNQLEDTFPNWLQTLPYLEVLILKANKKNDRRSVPTQEQNATYIDSVTVTTKAISMTLNKIPTNFINIDLSINKFEGKIPNVFGELHALKGLNLSHNKFSGSIPQSMGNLTNLESLDLSSNMLNGRIPTELTNLNFLEVLKLSHNHLVGEIPQGKQFNTFLNDSYEGNLELCGVPLSMKCNKDPEEHSPPSQTLWREDRFGFGWKPVAIGYGCGMVFGVGMGCCVLLIGKPQWLVKWLEVNLIRR
uniref:Systemin receptor SR160 family n=1 Tax=Cajanus cajan TaxID=3821 RepID=A0A151SXH2_CAJCA|nr:Systemin receptor SR160 family [Cajanus cajan]